MFSSGLGLGFRFQNIQHPIFDSSNQPTIVYPTIQPTHVRASMHTRIWFKRACGCARSSGASRCCSRKRRFLQLIRGVCSLGHRLASKSPVLKQERFLLAWQVAPGTSTLWAALGLRLSHLHSKKHLIIVGPYSHQWIPSRTRSGMNDHERRSIQLMCRQAPGL